MKKLLGIALFGTLLAGLALGPTTIARAGSPDNGDVVGVYAGTFHGENTVEQKPQVGTFWFRATGDGAIVEGGMTRVTADDDGLPTAREQALSGAYAVGVGGTAVISLMVTETPYTTGDPFYQLELKAVFTDKFAGIHWVQVGETYFDQNGGTDSWASVLVGEGAKQ